MPKRYFLFLNTKYNWIWIYIPFISASRMNLLIILLSFFNTTSHVQPATAPFLKDDGWPGSNWLKGRISGSSFLSRALCRGTVARRLLAKSAARLVNSR